MRKIKILAGCLLFCPLLLLAQTDKKTAPGFRFHSINQAGFVRGESGNAFLIQSVNGLTYKSWFAGIGAGIDEYYYSSVPVFLDVRRYLKHGQNSFFVYADGGISLPTDRKKLTGLGITFSSGLYYDVGLGYSVPLKKNTALAMSIGYTQKNTVKEEKGYSFFRGNEPQFINRHEYQLTRLGFKVGFVF